MKNLKLRLIYAIRKASKDFNFEGWDVVAFIWLFLLSLMVELGFCDFIASFVQQQIGPDLLWVVGLLVLTNALIVYAIIWLSLFIRDFVESKGKTKEELTKATLELHK